MGPLQLIRRYRINPIETVIVVGFGLLFCQSVYKLCTGYERIEAVMENHLPEKTRGLASVRDTQVTSHETGDQETAISTDPVILMTLGIPSAPPPGFTISSGLNTFRIELPHPDGTVIKRDIQLLPQR